MKSNSVPDISDAGVAAVEWFTPGRFAILLGMFIVAAFPDVVFGSKTFVFRDYGLFGYPLAHYHRECFWKGEIPLWNPLNNCGLPYLAQWNTMVLYPLSLVYLLLPLPWSLGIFCLLHLFLAGWGMYFLARRWTDHSLAAAIAGTAFAFNGLTLSCLMWPNNIAALGWMPWVLLLVERAWREGGRRHIVKAAWVGAVQMLSGAPEIFIFTWLLLLAIWLGQFSQATTARTKLFYRFAAIILLVTGLTAIQLLPFLDLLKHSQRDSGYGGLGWSMPPTGWANLLVPLFRAKETISGVFLQSGQFWTSSYYPGIGIFALAALAVWQVRRPAVWLLGTLTLLSLILALGDAGYLYGCMSRMIPQLGFMRYPVKMVVPAMCLIPLLAAFAVRRFLEKDRSSKVWIGLSTASLWAALLLVILAILRFAFLYPGENEQWACTLRSGWTRAVFLTLILGALTGLNRVTEQRKRSLFQFGLLLLVWLDLWTHAPRQNPTVASTVYQLGLPPLMEMNPHPNHGETRAMLSWSAINTFHNIMPNAFDGQLGHRLGLTHNCNLLEGIPKVDGFYSLYLPEEREVCSRLYSETNRIRSRLVDFLGVSQITAEGSNFDWVARPTALPMATVGQKPEFLNREQTLNALLQPDFDPKNVVYLPAAARAFISATNRAEAKILASKFSAHHATMTVEANQPSMLIVAQSFYHPWHAYVDGKAAQLWRANHAYQGLEVPAGHHEVTLAYNDPYFHLGALVSGTVLLSTIVAWFCKRRFLRSARH